MKINGIPKLLAIVVLIRKDLLWIDAPLQGIVLSLEERCFMEKQETKCGFLI